MAVLCVHADLTTETIKKRKFKWMLVHGMMEKQKKNNNTAILKYFNMNKKFTRGYTFFGIRVSMA